MTAARGLGFFADWRRRDARTDRAGVEEIGRVGQMFFDFWLGVAAIVGGLALIAYAIWSDLK
jgi:hypothetical protein